MKVFPVSRKTRLKRKKLSKRDERHFLGLLIIGLVALLCVAIFV